VFAAAAQGKGGPVGSGGVDEDLRELEREAQRGDPEARLRLLAAWRRAGRVDEERLNFAARLGDPVARMLLGTDAPAEEDLMGWLESVREHEPPWAVEVALRAAVTGARASLPVFERERPEDRGARQCVEAAEAFVTCPCTEHAAKARSASGWQGRAASDRSRRASHLPESDASRAERAAVHAAQAAGFDQRDGRAFVTSVLAFQNASGAAPPQVHDAARAALARWLLGA
jgi:hypothetical protein